MSKPDWRPEEVRREPMHKANCVLLADPHHGVMDGVRHLLATVFRAVVMVADEVSLFESAARLHSDVAILDLALARGNALEFVRRFRDHFPETKMIVMSVHSNSSVSRSILQAGADGYVLKCSIATDLLAAADAVLGGNQYVSPTTDTSRGECTLVLDASGGSPPR